MCDEQVALLRYDFSVLLSAAAVFERIVWERRVDALRMRVPPFKQRLYTIFAQDGAAAAFRDIREAEDQRQSVS